MIPPGARVEAWAPIQAPGIAPISRDDATAIEKLPNTRWPAAAEPTIGMAWTRSVPTSADAWSAGWSISRPTTTIDPAPTDVRPTMNPAPAPSRIVGSGRSTTAGLCGTPATPSPSGRWWRHI